MIRSTIRTFDHFPQMTEELELKALHALNEAAITAAEVAQQQARDVAHFEIVPAHPIFEGFSSGVKASPLARIYNKGSLGKHQGTLKRPRKPSWPVNRGSNPYIAQRSGDLEGKGVAARSIYTVARAAGRKVLLAAITR